MDVIAAPEGAMGKCARGGWEEVFRPDWQGPHRRAHARWQWLHRDVGEQETSEASEHGQNPEGVQLPGATPA